MFYPAALSVSAPSDSWRIAVALRSYPAVTVCCCTTRSPTPRQSPDPPPPSPLVSVVQNAPPPWSLSKDCRHSLQRNFPSGAQSLTHLERPIIPLFTTRASAATAAVSPFTAMQPNPTLTLRKKLGSIAPLSFWEMPYLTYYCNPPILYTNKLRNAQPNPIAPPRPPQTPAASSKSPYRKCPGGTHSGQPRLLCAGALVDRVLRFIANYHPTSCRRQSTQHSGSRARWISLGSQSLTAPWNSLAATFAGSGRQR